MSTRESVVQFTCGGARLVGIISHPANTPSSTGIVIVVGGPQYRVGSHRQFVLLARALASAGHAVLRFDCRGMGDSTGEAPGFEHIDVDIAAALDALQQVCPEVAHMVLWGLCDGASAALLYAQQTEDPRVVGLALANPWMHTEQAQAHAIVHTYYRQRLLDGAFWRKLVSGGINPLHKLGDLFRHWQGARGGTGADADPSVGGMLGALDKLRLPMLLLLCHKDATAQEFLSHVQLAGSSLLAQAHVRRIDFSDADHTFSRAEWRRDMETATIAWLNQMKMQS